MATEIAFSTGAPIEGRGRCPVCGASASTRFLTVGELALNRCSSCASLFYEAFAPANAHVAFDAAQWKEYVQIGAGIDSMLLPLAAVPIEKQASLLDVGCGFGFLVDYWSRVRGSRAVGLEIGPYGQAGRELLGIEIHQHPLDECAAVQSEKFDVVFASEVIEHVADPRTFIRQLKAVLNSGGRLILTTPSAGFVSADRQSTGHDRARLTAVLSPGAHHFLLSKEAFTEVLMSAGFAHVVVQERGQQLLAWASERELPEPRLPAGVPADYLDYLRALASNADGNVAGGALYRLFKEVVNAGDWRQANEVLSKLDELAFSAYGIRLESPSIKKASATASFVQHMALYPAWLGCALYYTGILIANDRNDIRGKLRVFEASASLLRHEMRLAPHLGQEASAHLPYAEFHYRQALIHNLRHEAPAAMGAGVEAPPEALRQRFAQELAELLKDLGPPSSS